MPQTSCSLNGKEHKPTVFEPSPSFVILKSLKRSFFYVLLSLLAPGPAHISAPMVLTTHGRALNSFHFLAVDNHLTVAVNPGWAICY